MINTIKRSFSVAFAITTCILTVAPESAFSKIQILKKVAADWNATVNRCFLLMIVYIASIIVTFVYYRYRRSINIKGRNYCIRVQYGNILKKDAIKNLFFRKKCWRVITFDECFTTSVGTEKWQIVFCKHFLEKIATYFGRMLHLQIGEFCKA